MRTAIKQAGMSLISIMVGLVISMIAILGLTSAYKVVVSSTVSAKNASTNDDQLTSALLRASMSLQDAGYGIVSPVFGTHIVLISGATLSGTTLGGTAVAAKVTANAIVWAVQKPDVATQCAGLFAAPAGGLISLGPVDCADATGWSLLAWPTATVIDAPTTTGEFRSKVSFVAEQSSCKPYGITDTSGTYSISLSTTNSAGVLVSSLYCLLNFQ
ncbi:MAG: hypothetical protein H7327_08935 [Herminiimonas sp.]|nr:hypothetical protein [Herminiimonas sp.]